MFADLSQEDLGIVIDAMDEKTFVYGEPVIKEGDTGDVLYVVEKGELACHKLIGNKMTQLKVY